MSKPVLILGAGGHAKVLIEALMQSGADIAGIADQDPAMVGAKLFNVPVIGGDDIVSEFPPGEIALVNGLGSIGFPVRRTQLFELFREKGYCFATVIHPSAVIASDVVLDEGVQIMAGAVIQPGCRIGRNAIINTRASVDHDCIIGHDVHIAPGVTLSGGVQVGDRVHIGTGAIVIQGIVIGNNSLIAAGAVVAANILADTKVRGIPAKEFK
jgi:UDP-perosamine 4-acetyltransferase